jgi:hypothetical protein
MFEKREGRRWFAPAATSLIALACSAAMPLQASAHKPIKSIPGAEAAAPLPAVLPSEDPFYKPPGGYATEPNGTVLRWRPADYEHLEGIGASAAYQILYVTSAGTGEKQATAATVFVPSHPAPGPRRLLSYQEGEDALAAKCEPSYAMRTAAGPGLVPLLLSQGWDVVVSDYEGPKSELLVGPLEGHATLDGIRAAEAIPGTELPGASTEVGLVGYSGGSVPTVWADALAPKYARSIDVAAVTAGGIDANPEYIIDHIEGSSLFGGVFLAMIGFDRAYPELNLDSILSSTGQVLAEEFGAASQGCGAVADEVLNTGSMAEFTNYPTAEAVADLRSVKKATKKLNLVTHGTPTAPGFFLNEVHDQIMFVPQVDEMTSAYCAAGDKVYYVRPPEGEHIAGGALFFPQALGYITQRFAGEPAPTTCGDPNNAVE